MQYDKIQMYNFGCGTEYIQVKSRATQMDEYFMKGKITQTDDVKVKKFN